MAGIKYLGWLIAQRGPGDVQLKLLDEDPLERKRCIQLILKYLGAKLDVVQGHRTTCTAQRPASVHAHYFRDWLAKRTPQRKLELGGVDILDVLVRQRQYNRRHVLFEHPLPPGPAFQRCVSLFRRPSSHQGPIATAAAPLHRPRLARTRRTGGGRPTRPDTY